MHRVSKLIKVGAVAITSAVIGLGVSTSSSRAALVDLAILLDSSGSIGSTNWGVATGALASAVDLIPTSGANQYRLTVISFSSSAVDIVSPIIVDAGNIAGIKTAISGASFQNGGTCMSCAFNLLVSDYSALTYGDVSLINMTTDGVPNSQAATTTAVGAAATAGWDGLSVEAIGSGVDMTFLASIAFPGTVVTDGTIPNPITNGFVLPVSDFSLYGDAIAAKIQRVVDETGQTPLPGALPMFVSGLGALGLLGWRRKRKAKVA